MTARTYSQHPVPQHVLGVEFKLVGGLTIHQFAYIGGSIILAYLTYASILPAIFRIPLAAFLVILGLSLALLPVNDRPLDVYLKNFLLAISSPTERVWIKAPATLDIFYESFATTAAPAATAHPGQSRQEIRDYFEKVKTGGGRTTLDLREEEYLKGLSLEMTGGEGLAGEKKETETFAPPPPPPFRPERVEVKPAPTLASEVNFSQEEIIPLSTGKTKRFVTTIKNVRAGRKLHSLPTVEGEIVMPVLGEVVLKTKEEAEEDQQKLLEQAAAAVSNLENQIQAAKKTVAGGPAPLSEVTPIPTPAATPPSPPPAAEKTPPPPQAAFAPPPGAPSEKAKLAGQMASLSEELERLREKNTELLLEVERQKAAREEAERLETELQRYQEKMKTLQVQNEKLTNEMRQTAGELKRIREEKTLSETEKENSIRQLREQQKRLEELAREKAESIDDIVRLQKELQGARLKAQKTAQETFYAPAKAKTEGGETGPGAARPDKPKPLAFIKDIPNVINGYVRGKDGSLIRNAVIIVKDQGNDVVRALKTNDLGQFAITTPLPNGLYQVEASAEGATFAIITVDLVGTVLEPIEFEGR